MFPQTFIYFKYIQVFSIIYINLRFAYKKVKIQSIQYKIL